MKRILIGLTVLLAAGCNQPVAATSAETLVDPVPGPTGPVGPRGVAGADGAQGPQGLAGSQGPAGTTFKLQDANGVVLGTYMGDGAVYNEDENVFARYDCLNGNGPNNVCTMRAVQAAYYGVNCTGDPWVAPTFSNQVFGANGEIWVVDLTQPPIHFGTGAYYGFANNQGFCSGSNIAINSNAWFYPAVRYTGVLPYSPPGPFKVVKI